MPWKWRGTRCYYYRSERRGGRVVSTYIGTNTEQAKLIARLGRIGRIRASLARHDEREARARDAKRERLVKRAVERSEALAAWALTSAGYHRPADRHDWRKRRMGSTTTLATTDPGAPPPSPLKLAGRLERALAGKLVQFSDENDHARESFRGEVLAFAGELAGPDPPPIIRATAHIAAIAYYDWAVCRLAANSPSPPPAVARGIERAERRFHRAARSLNALQRRLPEVLVAIGSINVGATAPAGGGAGGLP